MSGEMVQGIDENRLVGLTKQLVDIPSTTGQVIKKSFNTWVYGKSPIPRLEEIRW